MENVEDNISEASIEYKYIIMSHGAIVTSNEGNITKYMTINIPKNVEIFTYSNLGETKVGSCQKNYFICDNLDKVKSYNFIIETPIHKYKYISGAKNIFPEVFLTPDTNIIIGFYSGIVHCIPKHRRTSETKAMEIIYNIDALVNEDCNENTIGKSYKTFKPASEDNIKSYDTDKQYSTYYKEQLKNPRGTDSEASVNNKCGPLLLSQAIKVIQAHCKAIYPDCNTSTIQIYLSCCLGTMDIKAYYDYQDYFSKTNKEQIKEEFAEFDIGNGLEKRNAEEMEKYYKAMLDFYSLNIRSLINDKLYTTDLQDFDSAKILQEDTKNGYTYSYISSGKQFKLIVSPERKKPKYNSGTMRSISKIMIAAIISLRTRLKEWYIPYDDLPAVINIDSIDVEPNADNIYDKLLHFVIEKRLNSKLKYEGKFYNKECSIEFHLENNNYEKLKNETFSANISVINKQVESVMKFKINRQNIFKIVNNYIIKLNISDLIKDERVLYEIIIAQVKAEATTRAKEQATVGKSRWRFSLPWTKRGRTSTSRTHGGKKISYKSKKFRGRHTRRHRRIHRRIHRKNGNS